MAFVPLILIGVFLKRRVRDAGDWRALCDAALLPYILVDEGSGASRRPGLMLWALGGSLAILALAGPVWERLPAPALRSEAALVIALDLSRVMDAADITPSRLARARFKIEDILRRRKDGLTALLVYSGDAYTVTPLTDDVATIQAQLAALTSDLMPTQGSRADLALERAGRLLEQAGLTQGDVLLISNGVNLSRTEPAAGQLKARGYRLSVLGAGSEDGAPVPLPEGGYLQDTQGQIVISKLAVPALRQLAERSGGLYRTLATDDADVAALLAHFESQLRPASGEAAVRVEQWREQGPWLLLALLPVVALAFRRGLLLVCAVAVLSPFPTPARAWDGEDLWQTPDQRASRAFAEGNHAQAAQTFADPAWKAAAQYRAGDYEQAARTLESRDTADAHYNRGNALAKQGRYPGALAAYERALALSPGHEDALHNKALVEKAQQQRQEQEKKQDAAGDQGQKQSPQQGGNDNKGLDGKKPESGQKSEQQATDMDSHAQDKQGQESAEARAEEAEKNARRAEQAEAERADKPASREDSPIPAESPPGQREEKQANEQWLRRIPDDPGGLLRRKFYYQYQQRQGRER